MVCKNFSLKSFFIAKNPKIMFSTLTAHMTDEKIYVEFANGTYMIEVDAICNAVKTNL